MFIKLRSFLILLFSFVLLTSVANSAKFPEASKLAPGGEAELPEELKYVMKEKENFIIMDNNLKQIKDYILKNI